MGESLHGIWVSGLGRLEDIRDLIGVHEKNALELVNEVLTADVQTTIDG